VTAGKRSSVLPDLPTIAESGVPGYAIEGWVGLLAPAKTPTAVIAGATRAAPNPARADE